MKYAIVWSVATALCAAVAGLGLYCAAYFVAAMFLILTAAAAWSAIDEWIDYRFYRKHRTDVIRINPPTFPEQPKRGIR